MALRARSRRRGGSSLGAGRPGALVVGAVVVGAVVAVGATLAGGGSAGEPASGVPADAQAVLVEQVVDGDTLRVRAQADGSLPAGEISSVRLLEIDAPEVGRDGAVGECGAAAATDFLAGLAPAGAVVHVEADREDRDRYGRALRYVWLADGTHVNAEIVLEGHARAVLFEPNDRHIDVLRAAEKEARAAARGVWGPACAG